MLCGPQSAFDYACLASAGISSPRSEPPPALRGLLGRSRSAAAPWPARRHGEQLARQPGHGNFPTADIPWTRRLQTPSRAAYRPAVRMAARGERA